MPAGESPEAASDNFPPGRTREALAITAIFAVLLGIGISQHEWWRDEANPWLIAGAVGSVAELLAETQLAGHPPLWYGLLWALRTVGNTVLLPALLNAAFVTLAVWLVARFAPFSRAQRWLFPLGFFPLFQYGMVARSYGAVLCLLVLYCALRPRLHRQPFVAVLPLAILPWFHAFGAILAVVAVAVEGARMALAPRTTSWLRVAGALSLAALSAALATAPLTSVPRAALAPNSFELTTMVRPLGAGFLPTVETFAGVGFAVAGFAIWASTWLCFVRRPWALAHYAGWSGGLALFVVLIYRGAVWHHGFFFLFFLAGLWLAWSAGPPPAPAATAVLTVALTVQACAGLYAFTYDVRYPISDGNEAAAIMRSAGLQEIPIVGVYWAGERAGERAYEFNIDRVQSTIVHLPGTTTYNPNTREFDAFWRHYSEPEYFGTRLTEQELMAQLGAISRDLGNALVVVISRPRATQPRALPAPAERVYDMHARGRFGETLSIYRLPAEEASAR